MECSSCLCCLTDHIVTHNGWSESHSAPNPFKHSREAGWKKKKRAQICAEKKERKKESRRQTGQLCPVKCNWSLIKKGKSHAQGRSASHTLHRHRSSFLLQHLRDIWTCLLLFTLRNIFSDPRSTKEIGSPFERSHDEAPFYINAREQGELFAELSSDLLCRIVYEFNLTTYHFTLCVFSSLTSYRS